MLELAQPFVPVEYRAAMLRLAWVVTLLLQSLAQGQGMLADLNRFTDDPGSDPGPAAVVGTQVFFAAATPALGRELYRADLVASTAQLVRDLAPGTASSDPGFLTALGTQLLFTADDGTGLALWRTDGTPAGTTKVRPFNKVYGTAMLVLGSAAYFFADDGISGQELWGSDGTTAGTAMVVDLVPGPGGVFSLSFTVAAGKLWFVNVVSSRWDLMVSDGTKAGTAVVTSTATGGPVVNSDIGATSGGILFSGCPSSQGNDCQLWRSDGTAAGTKQLARLASTGAFPRNFVTAGAYTCFTAQTGGGSSQLWSTDGTAAGTISYPFFPDSYPPLTPSGTQLFFLGRDPAGKGLYRLDPALRTVNRLRDLGWPQLARIMTAGTPGSVYVVAFDPAANNNLFELWRSDGTPAGTQRVKIVRPGFQNANIALMATIGNLLLFSADDGNVGNEPWRSDGSASGTLVLANINQPAKVSGLSSAPDGFVDLLGTTMFMADDGLVGREPWRIDAASATPTLVADLTLGIQSSPAVFLTRLGDKALMVAPLASSGSYSGIAYLTDGTKFVRLQMPSTALSLSPFGVIPGRRVFTLAYTVIIGPSIYSWVGFHIDQSGTREGVRMPGSNLAPTWATLTEDREFFATGTSATGAELWTSAGLVKDIQPGPAGSNPGAGIHAALGKSLVFSADDGATGEELWISDGTAAGTVLLADLEPGPAGSAPRNGVASGNLVFFTATTAASGTELWRTDGTAAGTFLVSDLDPGTASSSPGSLVAHNGGVFFAATVVGDRELWFSDGTRLGTRLVANLVNGASSDPEPLLSLGSRRVLLTATEASTGRELWETDGTAAGTRRLAEVNPGPADGRIASVAQRMDGVVMFAGDDGIHGQEPWVYDPGAVAQTSFAGCSSARVPRMTATDPVLGTTTRVTLTQAVPNATGGLLIGTPAFSSFGSCVLHVDLNALVVVAPVSLDATGSATVQMAVPATASLAGVHVCVQAAIGPTATPPFGLDLSEAVHMRLSQR